MKFLFQYLLLCIALISCSKSDTINGNKFINFNDEEVILDVSDHKLSVFYFLAPECPLSQNYSKSINELSLKFDNEDVKFYAVFSGLTYTEEEMKSYLEDYEIKIEGLKDKDYILAKYFKATITPEVFLINDDENILYSGKIDNWIESLGVKRQVVTEYFLKDAIQNYLQGKEIIVSKTKAVGCVLE